MKRFLSIIAVSLVVMTASAQFNFGVKGGLNLSSVSLKGQLANNFDSENKAGFFIGPTVKFTLPIIGLGVDASALYNQSESEIEGTTIKRQAVSVPLNLRYGVGLGDFASVYLFAGPQFDFNVGDKDFSITGIGSTLADYDYSLKSTAISVNFGIGLMLINHLQASVNYNVACGNTADFKAKSIADNIDAKTNFWQVAVAYYF